VGVSSPRNHNPAAARRPVEETQTVRVVRICEPDAPVIVTNAPWCTARLASSTNVRRG